MPSQSIHGGFTAPPPLSLAPICDGRVVTMTDYGHPLLFGTLLEPPAGRPLEVLRLAEVTERAELDLVSLSDHPYWPNRLETLALLAAICAATDRVQVVSNLANLPLRPPTVLARAAATLDLLSGGRFGLGIGAG